MTGGASPALAAAISGGLAAVAAWQAVAASPAILEWLRTSIEPWRRAGREGYLPSSAERRRLAAVGAALAVVAGWVAIGPALALPMTVIGPWAALAAVRRRRAGYVRSVERALPEIARALADGLIAGRSLRGALEGLPDSLEGPAAAELSRAAAEIGTGAPTDLAVGEIGSRLASERVDAFIGALLSQRVAGGDLADLLRRFAEGAAERDRVIEDARTATAQARFTGLMVVAMPLGGAGLAQLLAPGFAASLTGSLPALVLLGLAAGLQACGFLVIRRVASLGAG